ncbi:Rv3235 family protein [Streptomyces buecherae]|uniref:Rv3235 family protein n=1 Tax=Streptomyces buecherae TaxID=2763006 RepID=UPI001E5EA1F8|nr:Rv3235 family protein [Streptomyces buecherae]
MERRSTGAATRGTTSATTRARPAPPRTEPATPPRGRAAADGTPGTLGPGAAIAAGAGPGGHRVPRQYSGPPRRRDQRRPGGADLAARHRARERLPRYWFANRLLLTLSGQRPVHWMLGHTQGAAYDQLTRLAPHPSLCPPTTTSATARAAARTHPTGPGPRVWPPVVRHCDEFRPEPWVIEAFARIAAGDRLRALAFRLEEGADGRWRCAAIDLGHPPGHPGPP